MREVRFDVRRKDLDGICNLCSPDLVSVVVVVVVVIVVFIHHKTSSSDMSELI